MQGLEDHPGVVSLTFRQLYHQRVDSLRSAGPICKVAVVYLEVCNDVVSTFSAPTGHFSSRRTTRLRTLPSPASPPRRGRRKAPCGSCSWKETNTGDSASPMPTPCHHCPMSSSRSTSLTPRP
ncbi:hypothetical protein HPB49_017913 [Dermacentor silvarum]|uniref:Uncharacterized protein n=1 Tax=Dermacentor silvarum TaxID=543639 RepID=A0ACB8E229_DERSI|nr:hypothetical protein HPB49_017913 [Dermacentor silvarum]